MKKEEEEIGLRRKWGAKGDGSLKNFNQFYCCERSPGSCRGNLLGLKRSTIMIGFSLDIDLTAVFPRLSRHLPAYLATYEPVRRNIATETARDGRREEHRALSATSWRLFKFKTGRDRSRAAVTASCSFILCLFFFTEARRARPFSLSRVSPPLIPGSCRSSPRPARPSKNSLTCLADSPSLYLSSDSANFLYVLCVERGKETARRRGPGWRTDPTDSLFVPLLFASWGREEPRACLAPGFKKCLRETRKRLCVSKCGKETKGAGCCVLRSDV